MIESQPKALRLADELEVTNGLFMKNAAATELRRLHEANQELLTELKKFTNAMTACMDWPDTIADVVTLAKLAESARAAIAKATGVTK